MGVLGCMAERVKAGLLSQGVTSVVAGPDSYRDLPRLLASQRLTGQAAIFFCQHSYLWWKYNLHKNLEAEGFFGWFNLHKT